MLLAPENRGIWIKANVALGTPVAPYTAALMDRAKVTRDEAFVLTIIGRTLWAYLLQIIPTVDELSPIERAEFENTIRFHFGLLGGPNRIFYESYVKTQGHPDALRYIDGVLARPK
jgi:hypothetical protein